MNLIPKQAEKLNKDEMMYLEGGLGPGLIIYGAIFVGAMGAGYWSTRW